MKLYKTKKNCGKLLLGILAFCTGMILLTGCGSSSEQKQNKNEETAEENKEEDKVQIGLTVDSFVIEDGSATEMYLWRLPENWEQR